MPGSENVKVAVRVRPFSNREVSRKARLIVTMSGNTTSVINPDKPKDAPKNFTFDHSYWSHDGFKEQANGYLEPGSSKYTDQNRVYNDIGKGMIDNAWGGYNCSVFAYGQTSSGKSYTIMGHGANPGLVPRTCEELFLSMDRKKTPEVIYEITFSMLEIYNEEVRDLLNKKKNPPGGLKIKESQQRGFYVENLTIVPVGSFKDIKLRMNEGDRQRTIASTKMNETSSRAHTIVAITFAQKNIRQKTTKQSTINLVDLAGSERAKQTEATGDRFEEAKNINKSLMTLGSVIKALCDKATKKSSSVHVPYRDAILTKLLKNALGGNSRTCMVAAISPDAENYEQTLSTLRYADRAKAIKTEARVNQAATDKMIQELIAEKERLLKDLENARHGGAGFNREEIQKLKEEQQAEINRYKEMMLDTEKSWQNRLEEARKEMEEMSAKEKQQEEEEKKIPHFINLNEDPALTGKLVHLCQPGNSKIGNGKDGTCPDIALNGPRLAKDHAEVINRQGEVSLKPVNGMVLHNGKEITKTVKLQHQDRVRFGSNNLFVFIHPLEADSLRRKGRQQIDITYEFAQDEIAKHSGLELSAGDNILQDEVMSVMQLVNDVNAMAEDMEKALELSIILVSAEARGHDTGRTEVFVKAQDLENGNQYLWDKTKFLNRQVHMQTAYQQFEETGAIPVMDKEKDPFWELPNTDVIIGVATVPLNYLSHMIDFTEEPLTVVDYQAKSTGFLQVELTPCGSSGNEDVDLCVDDPMDLIGKAIAFKVKVLQAMNLPDRFEKTWCKYKFYDSPRYFETDIVSGKNPTYQHKKLLSYRKGEVDHKFIEYLREKYLSIEVWGQQGEQGTTPGAKHKRQEEKQRMLDELEEWKTKAELLQEKLDRIKAITSKMPTSLEVKKIRKILTD